MAIWQSVHAAEMLGGVSDAPGPQSGSWTPDTIQRLHCNNVKKSVKLLRIKYGTSYHQSYFVVLCLSRGQSSGDQSSSAQIRLLMRRKAGSGETSLMIANWRRSSQMEKDYDSQPTPDLTPISNNHQLIIEATILAAEIRTKRDNLTHLQVEKTRVDNLDLDTFHPRKSNIWSS